MIFKVADVRVSPRGCSTSSRLEESRRASNAPRWIASASGLLLLTVYSTMAAPQVHGEDPGPEPALAEIRSLPLPAEQISRLRTYLRSGHLAEVPRALFRDAYDPSLADLIFYMEGPGRINHVRLVRKDRARVKLHSARHIWVMVFVGQKALRDSAENKKVLPRRKDVVIDSIIPVDDTLRRSGRATFTFVEETTRPSVRIEPLDYRRGIVETVVLQGLLGLITGGKSFGAEAEKPKDDTTSFTFTELGSSDGEPLYYGYAKFPLAENTINRFRAEVNGMRGYATVPNYSSSSSGVSIATLLTFPATSRAQWRDAEVDPHVLFHFYFMRPERPRLKDLSTPAGVGAFIGTKFETALKEFSLGLTVDHLFGEIGFIGGVVYEKSVVEGQRRKWLTNYCVGISYAL